MVKHLDHVVLWVDDPLRSVEFYSRVIGLPGERVEEFREGKAPFPSLRVSPDSIIDLMARTGADHVDSLHGVPGSAGNQTNHLCLAMDKAEFDELRSNLERASVTILNTFENTFGARGTAHQAIYFPDPDGNVIEARYYS